MSEKNFSRREFLQYTGTGLGSFFLPVSALGAGIKGLSSRMTSNDKFIVDPHFFLNVTVLGGLDMSYLFDARALAMTQAGIKQNTLKTEPHPWIGSNGIQTLATDLTSPLEAYRNDFSIVSGVVMSSNFDGHDQNLNCLFTGDPFGGNSFVPVLNQISGRINTPLDGMISSDFFAVYDNHSKVIPLNTDSANKLIERMKKPGNLPSDVTQKIIQANLNRLSQGSGQFSLGARRMADGFRLLPELSNKISQATPPTDPNKEAAFLKLGLEFFKQGLTRSLILSLSTEKDGTTYTSDTHAGEDAAKQEAMFRMLVDKLVLIFKTLKETPYDEQRSFFDVTTVLFATEFGRTLRQKGVAIEKTGTDHNPMVNTLLLAGKGIRKGLVLGSSDYMEEKEILSPAHMQLDTDKLKIMGKPYDFDKETSRTDLPEKFQLKDYLTVNSVINSVYKVFNVPQENYWLIGRNEGVAPTLKSLVL